MKDIVEYIIGINIRASIYQAILESKQDDPSFCEIDELAHAVAADTVRFLEAKNLIKIAKPTEKEG